MSLENHHKGLLLVLFTAIISGVSIFVNSIGVKEFNSSLFTFLKNGVVAIFLFSLIILAGKLNEIKSLNKKQWWSLALVGLIGGSAAFLLFFKGLQLTTGTTASFIHKTLFIFIGIFSFIFIKEKPSKGFIIGAILIMAGTYFMIKPNFVFSIGHLMVFGAVILWTAENILAKKLISSISGTIIAFGRMFFGSLFILVYLSFTGEIFLVEKVTSANLLWIGILSLFLFLYVLTFYNGIKHIRISTAASILSIGAPITAILSYIFSGKVITSMQIIGVILILFGVVTVVYYSSVYSFLLNKLVAKQYGRI